MAAMSLYHEGVTVKLVEPAVVTGDIERRRFGRTEIQMPVFTCGGMRTQQGPHTDGMTPEDVEAECQKNLDDIVKRSLELGINHFETARVYGCSELMYGVTLKKAINEWGYRREDMIVQTKLTFRTDCPKTFRSELEDCFERMQMASDDEYFDLFSFHNLMRDEQLEWITREGGLMEVVEEYRAKGKIKWVGFSTHAMTPTAVKACDSGVFDYMNVHYQFVGCNTATGTGPHKDLGGLRANWAVIEAAKRQDMGIFIISPTDKGGQLFKPPQKLADACAPLSPIEFNNLWLLRHPEVHTLVIGASRPGDFDEHMHSIRRISETETLIPPIEAKLYELLKEAHGSEWLDSWSVGLPDTWGMIDGDGPERNLENNPKLVNFNLILWLWTLAKAFDMVQFGRYRYAGLLGNLSKWDETKSFDDNYKVQLDSPNPGLPLEGVEDITTTLAPYVAKSPFPKRVLAALEEAKAMFCKDSVIKLPPFAYDMQPDKPWPERQGQVDFTEAERLAKQQQEEMTAAMKQASSAHACTTCITTTVTTTTTVQDGTTTTTTTTETKTKLTDR